MKKCNLLKFLWFNCLNRGAQTGFIINNYVLVCNWCVCGVCVSNACVRKGQKSIKNNRKVNNFSLSYSGTPNKVLLVFLCFFNDYISFFDIYPLRISV